MSLYTKLFPLRCGLNAVRLRASTILKEDVSLRRLSCSKWDRVKGSCFQGMRYFPVLYGGTQHLGVVKMEPGCRQASDFQGAPPTHDDECVLTEAEYEDVCEETLESLADAFEELTEGDLGSSDFDVEYSSGVLTVNLGQHGTYVINKQTPNKQVWLSSPVSGPKRYDYRSGVWIYKHDGVTLHQLITTELTAAFGQPVDFSTCAYSTTES